MDHVSSAPPQFGTSGFPGYGFKRLAPHKSSVRSLPPDTPWSRLSQPYPRHLPGLCTVLRHRGLFGRCRLLRTGMPCRKGHLSPEDLARDGLCRPALQRFTDLFRQSGRLRVISRFPAMGAVLDIQVSHRPLSVLLTFRSFTAELSRIAAVSTPENPTRAPRFFCIGSGHRAGSRPFAFPSVPTFSLAWEQLCEASYNRSLSLRPSGLLAALAD